MKTLEERIYEIECLIDTVDDAGYIKQLMIILDDLKAEKRKTKKAA